MTRSIGSFLIALAVSSVIVSTAHAAKCDDACMAEVAAKVDTEVAALSPADRAIIERVKPTLDTVDIDKIGAVMRNLEKDPKWRIENPEHRALWHEIAYIAIGYANTTADCFARGFWVKLYVDTWDEAQADKREARYNHAQYYLATRHGKDGYKCRQDGGK